jgi:PD-(D/E)XK nuclease superfamily protein
VPVQLSLFAPDPERPDAPSPPPGGVLVARGALAAEALLLARLEALVAAARREPALLARPVRIVVPSRSLRFHLGAVLARAGGRSVAGVVVQTLHGLAFEVLECAGEPAPRGLPLADVVAQRLAQAEPALARGLGGLVDGYAAVAATVRDLLDAGLEPAHADAADEALASDGPGVATRAEVERARALVRVAARAEEVLRGLELGRVSTLLRRAAEILEADPEGALPARAILVHGFADATGVATDLLESLVRRRGAWLVLDRPPAAGAPTAGRRATPVEAAFTARLAERLARVTRVANIEPAADPPAPPPRLAGFAAAGSEAEARELAVRVRALLDGGARPEGIAVVARDLARYRLPLCRHFRRLGIPFSALGERGALAPAGRRARAFLELVRCGEEVPADRWLDALADGGGAAGTTGSPRVDLRLALYALGAGRLRDVADLPVGEILGESGSYPLPIRQGLRAREGGEAEAGEEGDERSAAGAPRRRVAGDVLASAARAAGRARRRLAAWPQEAPAADHLRQLRALLLRDLAWDAADPDARPVLAVLEALEREVPARFPLVRDELRLLLARALAEAGTAELGGQGGGVQVLAVVEARGRTFEHLFVAGLNRDLFPRGVREDPLLPDDLRRVLARVLPDVPIKRGGFDEERYLFAQLLSASPAVTLSWQTADDDGRPLSPSPLLERLRGAFAPEPAPPLYALPPPGGGRALRPADEHAVLAALHAPRQEFAGALVPALAEARAAIVPGTPGTGRIDILDPAPRELAAARLAVLDELDPDRRTAAGRATAAGLGPYFGFVGGFGENPGAAEPRRRDLYVTHLENLAACPWQLFLGRLLRLEPTPDPLAALPGADPLLLGNLVHAALERLVRDTAPEVFARGHEELAARIPVLVRWPAEEVVERLLREEAARLLRAEGVPLPGLVRALAARALPLLEAARDLDWAGGVVPVLAVEAEGSVVVRDATGRPRTLRFKADRVDRAEGGLRWTDYKTGRPISDKKQAATRRRHFLERVRAGTLLQGVAYLLAGPEGESARPPSVGRYLYLRPGPGGRAEREFEVAAVDGDFARAFAASVEAVLGAWDAGAFFPRVVDPAGEKEPGRCSFCAVAEACLRGDSGARLRLFEWSERARAETGGAGREEGGAAERALLAVWRLAAKAAPGEEEAG